jgi:hemerythrin
MTEFAWQQAYQIDVPEIDAQHRNLFALGEALTRATQAGEAAPLLHGRLCELLAASQQHFATEEHLMEASGFPARAHHKHQHDCFVQKAVALAGDFEAGRTGLEATVLPFLGRWMKHHIVTEDRALGVRLNAPPDPV